MSRRRPGELLMPLAESLSIMQTLDAIRAELGLRFPTE
jgi:hypothetical protein